MIRFLPFCCALAFAAPAYASKFTPPESCTLEMTVQNRSCTVSQHYRCTTDSAGDQRVRVYDESGAVFDSRIDRETRWVESTNLRIGLTDLLEPQARDHASFATLMATGHDDFDFWTRTDNGQRLNHIGQDRLTGETTEIDGVTLKITRFELKTYSEDGQELIHRTGRQFVSQPHGRFYGGVETASDWTGTSIESNDSPVTFSFPGHPGFGLTTPQYDCSLQMVRQSLPPGPNHPA